MREPELPDGLDAVHAAILPSLSLMLDTLLDSAALARPGHDAERHAGELRALAAELEALVREVETLPAALAQSTRAA